jgi:hypothetical protein
MNKFPNTLDARSYSSSIGMLRLGISNILMNIGKFPCYYSSDNRYYTGDTCYYTGDSSFEQNSVEQNSNEQNNEHEVGLMFGDIYKEELMNFKQIADELSDKNFICEVKTNCDNDGFKNSKDYFYISIVIDIPTREKCSFF